MLSTPTISSGAWAFKTLPAEEHAHPLSERKVTAMQKQTMTVTHIATGRQRQVPKGLHVDALERHIQAVIATEAEAAARAEEVAKTAAMKSDIRAMEELSSQQQLVAANRHNAAIQEKLQALKCATPEPPTCCWLCNRDPAKPAKPCRY